MRVIPPQSIPHGLQRMLLPLSAVLVQALDDSGRPIEGAVASGFVRREGLSNFLYTCWHVVTGFDPHELQVGLRLPQRRFLRVALQTMTERQPGFQAIGGIQEVEIPLYEDTASMARPLWQQDEQHVPHPDLNAVGIFVPFWHDSVKIELPDTLRIGDYQAIDETRTVADGHRANIGDKCLVVGFPYGFSSYGDEQPTPVVLTRYVAADRVKGRHQQILLESIAAPGMSGGPVFLEHDHRILLLGMYTGLIFPDHARPTRERVTALGTVTVLSLLFWGALKFTRTPSIPEP